MSSAPAKGLRVVLDTNIYVPALKSRNGRNFALFFAAIEGKYVLLVSPAIIRELARVLRRDISWQEDRVQRAIRLVVRTAQVIASAGEELEAVKADPDDDRILECAVDGKADLIVSNDHHLLDLKNFRGIPIMAGVDFRRTLGMK
jgi:uncharacterized protein